MNSWIFRLFWFYVLMLELLQALWGVCYYQCVCVCVSDVFGVLTFMKATPSPWNRFCYTLFFFFFFFLNTFVHPAVKISVWGHCVLLKSACVCARVFFNCMSISWCVSFLSCTKSCTPSEWCNMTMIFLPPAPDSLLSRAERRLVKMFSAPPIKQQQKSVDQTVSQSVTRTLTLSLDGACWPDEIQRALAEFSLLSNWNQTGVKLSSRLLTFSSSVNY